MDFSNIILFCLSLVILLTGFYTKGFNFIFGLYYDLVNNIFKLILIMPVILGFILLIFEPSLESIYFINEKFIYLR